MTYKEGTKYKLQVNYYESVVLECISVQDGQAYFEDKSKGSYLLNDNYKVFIKTNKLYKWNDKFKSWDSIENTLSEHSADDIWSKRTVNGSGGGYYSGNIGQGD
jgi:hypothetical protein